MPHGVLFRGGTEQRIRQCLIENDQLEAVIGLPPNLFYSTTIPACLLIFRSRKTRVRRGQVLFVDGSARFARGKNQNLMSQSDVDAIGRAYRSGDDPDGVGGVAVRLISHEEIQQNDWDLSVGRYIKAEVVAGGTLDHALAEFRSAQEALRRAEAALDVRLKGAGVE